ncbi:uncharacterized protein LOC144504253 [Mustelus asterias]
MSAKQFQTQLPNNQQISKCFDVMVQSQVKWEKLVLPTIESVAILSGLVYQASKIKDIKLDQGSANKGSQNPQSLYSWLMKVCNKTENVFREKINHVRTIQDCGEVIVENLTKMSEGSVQKTDFCQLLDKTKEEADLCQKSAESVVKGLSDLTDLVSKLLNMCEASQTSSQEEVNEIRKTLKENKERYESVKVEKENVYKDWEQISQKREKISTELASINSGAFIDELCAEAVKQLIPKIVDLVTKVTNPAVLTMELLEGLKSLLNLGAKLISKDPEQSTEISEILQKVKERAAEKIQEVQDELEKSNRDYDKKFEEMKNLSKEGAILLEKIKGNQTEESKICTSLELMTKGLLALGSIKTNWSEVINFIQMIPLITGECGKVFESFDAVGDGDRQGVPGIAASNQNQVSQAVNIISIIGDVLKTYVEIYEKHLEVPLSDMGSLLAGQGSPEYKFNQIQKKCNAARKAIHNKATENQKGFEKSSAEAIEKLRARESRK